MGRREDGACCGPEDAERSFAESVELGHRRRRTVTRVSALASALAFVAGLSIPVFVENLPAGRLLWVAALFSLPLLFGHLRQLMVTRRVPWQLIVAGGLVTIGVIGHPAIPAAASTIWLGITALRPVPASEPSCDLQATGATGARTAR